MARDRGKVSRGIRKRKSATRNKAKLGAQKQANMESFTVHDGEKGDIATERSNDNLSLAYEGPMEQESQMPQSNLKKETDAYGKLMHRFETQHPSLPAKTKRGKKRRPVPVSENGQQREEPATTQNSEDQEALRTLLGAENAAATARENRHFELHNATEISPFQHVKPLSAGLRDAKIFTNMQPQHRKEFQLRVEPCESVKSLGLPPNMYFKWRQSVENKGPDEFGDTEKWFASAMREYLDLFLAFRPTVSQETRIRQLLAAHCLAHALRCRRRVRRNDMAVRANPEMETPKDQGFARPRVLILAPMKNVAYDIVSTMLKLAAPETEGGQQFHIANHERFESEFAPDDLEESALDDDEEADNVAASMKKPKKKPSDHRHTFRGNIDDDFKLGISFTRKTVKLFADFYSSDVIVASPLGLLRRNAEKARNPGGDKRHEKKDDGDTEWKTGISSEQKKKVADPDDDGFLSSIEICVVDGAHIFSMQNWDSVVRVMAMINKMPTNVRETDFSRVREWCLNGEMRRYRQTVVLSHYRKSEFLSLMRSFTNHGGRVDIIQTPSKHGTMSDVAINIRQTFLKVSDVSSPLEAPEKRFEFFFDSTLPMLREFSDLRCLIVIPSYFDFVRVRNKFVHLSEEDSSFRFASMCEYSKGADISRARGRLYDGSVPFVLMTERFHFFWRHWLRGAKSIVWYGLPENGVFYPEILNMTAEAAEMGNSVQSVALYDSLDRFRLQPVVGQERCQKMLASDSSSRFLFC